MEVRKGSDRKETRVMTRQESVPHKAERECAGWPAVRASVSPQQEKKSMAARFVPVKGYDEFFKVEPCESAFKMKS